MNKENNVINIIYDELTIQDYEKYNVLNMGYYNFAISLEEFYSIYYIFEEALKIQKLGVRLIVEKITIGQFQNYKILVYTYDIEDLNDIINIGSNIMEILGKDIKLNYETVKRMNGEKIKLVLINNELKLESS